MIEVLSPVAGKLIPLEEVADPVFSQRVMGDGVALLPESESVAAPVTGRIEKLFEGGHGFVIETPEGVQVLVHVGIDTVQLKGEGFTVGAREGDEVVTGNHVVGIDLARLRAKGTDMTTPVVVISGHEVVDVAAGRIRTGVPLFRVAR